MTAIGQWCARVGGALGYFVARFTEEREIHQYDLADQLLFAVDREAKRSPETNRIHFPALFGKARDRCHASMVRCASQLIWQVRERMPGESDRNRSCPVLCGDITLCGDKTLLHLHDLRTSAGAKECLGKRGIFPCRPAPPPDGQTDRTSGLWFWQMAGSFWSPPTWRPGAGCSGCFSLSTSLKGSRDD